MKFKRVMALSAAAAMLAGMTLNVSAAQPSVGRYVDGLKTKKQVELILDVEAYRAAYNDLDEAFGDDLDAYVEHYLTAGVYEGRTKGVLFDPLAYAEGYEDIKDAFGEDVLAIVSHYVNCGVEEKRSIGTAAGYEDIEEAVEKGAVQRVKRGEGSRSENAVSAAGEICEAAESRQDNEAGSAAVSGQTAVSEASGVQAAGGSTEIHYWRTTSIYANDNVTLLRVEYYDENNNLIFYSVVTDYDSSTNSYTEDIYSRDMEHVRTDTYVNGTTAVR